MHKLIEINSVAEYVGCVQELYHSGEFRTEKHLFFRGQGDVSWELKPKVFRSFAGENNFSEKDILLDFRQYAPEHNLEYDFVYDCDKVLGDMQHFGLPTRLLDWTISPLVALYFAVCESKDADGRIFIFDPWGYNKEIADYKIPEVHQTHVLARALLAYHWKFGDIVDCLKKKFIRVDLSEEDIVKPFSFVSQFTNKRKLMQRGCFTIHGTDEGRLDKWGKGEESICYWTIKKKKKEAIREELNILYVNEYAIFPDFKGMNAMVERYGSLFNWQKRSTRPS